MSTWLRTRGHPGVTERRDHQPDLTSPLAGLELHALRVGADIVYLASSSLQTGLEVQ